MKIDVNLEFRYCDKCGKEIFIGQKVVTFGDLTKRAEHLYHHHRSEKVQPNTELSWFKTLKLTYPTSPSQALKQYRKLSKQCHPDHFMFDEAKRLVAEKQQANLNQAHSEAEAYFAQKEKG